jgi:hypothetical protein
LGSLSRPVTPCRVSGDAVRTDTGLLGAMCTAALLAPAIGLTERSELGTVGVEASAGYCFNIFV